MTTPDPATDRVGRWLAAELTRRDLSVPQVATLLGVYAPTVYRWTTGRHRPRADAYLAITRILDVELNLVLTQAGYHTEDLTIEGAVRRQILELVVALPEELLLPLVPMLQDLAAQHAGAELRHALAQMARPIDGAA